MTDFRDLTDLASRAQGGGAVEVVGGECVWRRWW